MSEPALPTPAYSFGRVVAHVIDAVGDIGPTGDDLPDGPPVQLAAAFTFVPVSLSRVVPGATPPSTWVRQQSVTADLDADGDLSRNDHKGLWLWAGVWTVKPAAALGVASFQIEVTTSHTQDAPLDLWTQAPWTPGPGQTVTTLVVPSGAAAGRILGWGGTGLAWQDMPDGVPGPQGVGVASISDSDGDGVATVTLTDPVTGTSSTSQLPLPRGKDGDPGSPGSPGSPGADGHTPVLSWTGDQIAIDGQVTGPHLTGPQGTSTGGSAALQIVGAGRPDITSTMTADVQTAVAAATVGTAFVSTDGPQGAWVWRRRATGWVCTDGDTGIRRFTVTAAPAAANACFIDLRRIGQQVTATISSPTSNFWSWKLPNGIPAGSQITVLSVPTGFQSQAAIPGMLYEDGKSAIPAVLVALAASDSPVVQLKSSAGVDATLTTHVRSEPLIWTTSDQWPATLPGTAS